MYRTEFALRRKNVSTDRQIVYVCDSGKLDGRILFQGGCRNRI